MIVLDTHVFLWYASGAPELSKSLGDQIAASRNQVLVPTIVFWEIAMLVERGRVVVSDSSLDDFLSLLMNRSGFSEAPLTREIALLSRSLPFRHDDPADRFIAATAKAYEASLATIDQRLTGLPWLKVLS